MNTLTRPIEFRAFHKPTGLLFPVGYFTEFEVFRSPNHAYWLDECILMQFTGLYDSTGRKIFEGDVLYSFYSAHGAEPSREYWRVIVYRAGGFCEAPTIHQDLSEFDVEMLSDYNAAHESEHLPDRIVDCYYLRPDLLDLNTESGEVPESFV